MKAYAVVENCQEGIEAETGYAAILGVFLFDGGFLFDNDKSKAKALEKAEECLRKRYSEVLDGTSSEGEIENGNEPDYDDDNMLVASWVQSGNDTAHFLDVREIDVTEC